MSAERFPVAARWQWAKFIPAELVERVPRFIPWGLIAEHEQQVIVNHDAPLSRLADRGGLTPFELWCAFTGRNPCQEPYSTIREHEAAEWLASISEEP